MPSGCDLTPTASGGSPGQKEGPRGGGPNFVKRGTVTATTPTVAVVGRYTTTGVGRLNSACRASSSAQRPPVCSGRDRVSGRDGPPGRAAGAVLLRVRG